jgi:hypothetical protein
LASVSPSWRALLGGWRGDAAAEEPQGELTYAMHTTIAPVWFDPADNTGIAVPAAPAGGTAWGLGA